MARTAKWGDTKMFAALVCFLALIVVFFGLRYKNSLLSTNHGTITTANPTPTSKGPMYLKVEELQSNLIYPSSWETSIRADFTDDHGLSCGDLLIDSPDYHYNTEGYPYQDGGAEIRVRICPTQTASVQTEFNSSPLLKEIAHNIIHTQVSSHPAIQYTWEWEAATATDTMFIAKGYLYLVQLRGYGAADKYWDTYSELLSSLKI